MSIRSETGDLHRPYLTVAVCTKDRPEALLRLGEALGRQRASRPWEVLIVDDGLLGRDVLAELEARLPEGVGLRHRKKTETDPAGLYGSRVAAVVESRGDVVVFLDDDAVPFSDYLETVARAFAAEPELAGVGGVDVRDLPEFASGAASAYARFFLLRGKGPGDLSVTGFNHSQMTWRSQLARFPARFLHGCNMAFRREALAGLPELPWLEGHSCCEDLVLSSVAASRGRLAVDPALKVEHVPWPGGRGNAAARLGSYLRNHAEFEAWRSGKRPGFRFAWSLVGLLAKDVLAKRGKRGLGATEILREYVIAAKLPFLRPGASLRRE